MGKAPPASPAVIAAHALGTLGHYLSQAKCSCPAIHHSSCSVGPSLAIIPGLRSQVVPDSQHFPTVVQFPAPMAVIHVQSVGQTTSEPIVGPFPDFLRSFCGLGSLFEKCLKNVRAIWCVIGRALPPVYMEFVGGQIIVHAVGFQLLCKIPPHAILEAHRLRSVKMFGWVGLEKFLS